MNLVFPALVVFGFILPGILFRWAFSKGLWDYPLGKLGPVAEQIPKSVGWAIILNGAWAVVIHFLNRSFPRSCGQWLGDLRSLGYRRRIITDAT